MAVVLEDVGRPTATWTDPTGEVWQLSDSSPDGPGWFTPPGPSGWNATGYEIVPDPMPRGGENVRFVRAKPARIIWPLYVYGDTHLAYLQHLRQIKKAFTMTVHRRAAGTLTVTRPDGGGARAIDCYYESGFEGEAEQGWLYSKDAIVLFAPDGYWRDVEPVTVVHSYIPGVSYLSPFPQVSASLALGENEITNDGDVDAWPTWTITGPMSSISATNNTTGYQFTLGYGLAAGEQITITTFQPAVRGPSGGNLSQNLDWPNAYLWWLAPGGNQVTFNVAGGDVGTSVQVQFHPRYEGA